MVSFKILLPLALILTSALELGSGEESGEFVTIYAGKYFQGKERDIFITDNGCFTLFDDWYGAVQSIKFGSNVCIQLYDRPKCDGKSKILNGRFKTDRDQGQNLALVNFDRQVHSVHLC